jgi:hypothetical protein
MAGILKKRLGDYFLSGVSATLPQHRIFDRQKTIQNMN